MCNLGTINSYLFASTLIIAFFVGNIFSNYQFMSNSPLFGENLLFSTYCRVSSFHVKIFWCYAHIIGVFVLLLAFSN